VAFRQPEEADVCIAAVHRRWFDGRSLVAEAWDGRTKYTVKESEEEMAKRLNKWHSYIEEDSTKAEDKSQTPSDGVPDASDTSSRSAAVVQDGAVQDATKKSSNDVNTKS